MKKYRRHRNGTTYEHSLKVAKKCFLFCKRHMFPLTIVPPLTKEGWLVCFFDKIIALNDYLQPNQV